MITFSDFPPPVQQYVTRYSQAKTNESLQDAINTFFTMATVNTQFNSAFDAKRESLFDETIREIKHYSEFQYGWDGYHGLPFNEKVLRRALKIVDIAEKTFQSRELVPDDITPGPASDGSVDTEIIYHGKSLVFLIYPEEQAIRCHKYQKEKMEELIIDDESAMDAQFYWLIS